MTRQRLKKKPEGKMKRPRGWKKKLQKGFIQKKKEELLRKQPRKQRKQRESWMRSFKGKKRRG